MVPSFHTDDSPLYQEARDAYRDYIDFPHLGGETSRGLEIRARQAALRLFSEEGISAIERLGAETAGKFEWRCMIEEAVEAIRKKEGTTKT